MSKDDQGATPVHLERAPGGKVILCGGCLERGACRWGITEEALVGEFRTETVLTCPKDQEGGPGVAHGGWTAAVMDDVLGHLALLCGGMTVTAKLSVEFLRPVPIERPLRIIAWRENKVGNRWINVGELILVSTGVVLARAQGEFAERDRDRHFAKFREWLDTEDQKT